MSSEERPDLHTSLTIWQKHKRGGWGHGGFLCPALQFIFANCHQLSPFLLNSWKLWLFFQDLLLGCHPSAWAFTTTLLICIRVVRLEKLFALFLVLPVVTITCSLNVVGFCFYSSVSVFMLSSLNFVLPVTTEGFQMKLRLAADHSSFLHPFFSCLECFIQTTGGSF